ncbi:MAG: ABC transporter ATP-binding protein [Rhizobiales bacterium]|nr:ABC transporter ATP-binding protein [Hyphomicrobiales bacterium]
MNKQLVAMDMNITNSVEIDDFSLDYFIGANGWVRILREVGLSIGRGEVLGLVGESGCGKSSLAYNLLGYRAGNSRIPSGRLMVGQTDVGRLDRAALDKVRGRRVALVPQNPTTALSPHLRIRSQLAEVLVEHGYATETTAIEARLKELLFLVGLTDTDRILQSYPYELSGGQQQRIVIAMALSCDPEVLVLDEPTTGLDVTTQGQIVRLLAMLKRRIGLAMLYVTHDLNLLSQIADRVVVMYAGSVVETAPTATLFAAPGHPYTRGLIGSIPNIRQTARGGLRLQGILRRSEIGAGCPFAARCQYRQPLCEARHPESVAIAVKHDVACHFWRDLPAFDPVPERLDARRGAAGKGEVVLEVEHLAISYKRVELLGRWLGRTRQPVVKDVSLRVRRGEIVSLVGESGSGKSTIAKAITGMIDHVAGSVTYGGSVDLGMLRSRPVEVLREIQYVFQNPDESLNPRRTVGAALARPISRFRKGLSAGERQELIVEALREVQLDESYVHRYPGQLSGGERQRVAIARGLVAQPKLLLCDEILSALDVSVQAKVIDVLLDLKKQGEIAMLFISHDLSVVRAISDRVVVLYKGTIMEEGPTDAIYQPPYHPYTHMLLNAVPEPGRVSAEGEPAGEPPRLDPAGCVFANRCLWKKGTVCDSAVPPMRQAGDLRIRCHHDLATLSELATWQNGERQAGAR